MKYLFIAAGPYEWGSSRMRCYWTAEHLDADVVTFPMLVNEAGDVNIPLDYDVYIFQKQGHPEVQKALLERGKQVWIDHCDPMWWFSPNPVNEITRHSTGSVFSSKNLRNDFVEWYGKSGYPALVIPDRLKKEYFDHRKEHGPSVPVKLVWFGVSVNRVTLPGAMTNIMRLKAQGINVQLTIMDDRPDVVETKYDIPIYHVPFSVEHEVSVLAAHDIALLPPYPGPWGKVKSDNKTRTASACGLPVTDGFDYEELKELVLNPAYRRESVKEFKKPWVDSSAKDWERITKDYA